PMPTKEQVNYMHPTRANCRSVGGIALALAAMVSLIASCIRSENEGLSDNAEKRGPVDSVPCGCEGKPGCAVWQNVYVTWYGFNANSCQSEAQHSCANISNPGLGPKKHQRATAGAGTYDDPSTAAASEPSVPGHHFETAEGVTLVPGTLI